MWILQNTETGMFVNANGDWIENRDEAFQWEEVVHVERWMDHVGILGLAPFVITEY